MGLQPISIREQEASRPTRPEGGAIFRDILAYLRHFGSVARQSSETRNAIGMKKRKIRADPLRPSTTRCAIRTGMAQQACSYGETMRA